MDLSNSMKEALVKNAMALAHQAPALLGPATAMTCSCGGVLHQDIEAAAKNQARVQEVLVPPKPYHRKKRILKKRLRAWRDQQLIMQGLVACVGALRGPTYVCVKCHRRDGFYSAIGRNLFPVQQMPQGALPIYDKDPDVAAIVTENLK